MKKAWAPLLAVIFTAVLYRPMVDSVFYFLHGGESQGLLLAAALADGHGFVDLSLPGHPAQVREPPLFYLMLAGLIRVWGFRMGPMKMLIFFSYLATAIIGTIYFQRRSRPLSAFLAMALAITGPALFTSFTGPKTDVPFTACALAALLCLELLAEKIAPARRPADAAEKARAGRWQAPALAAAFTALALAAAFIRSLGLALLIGACGTAAWQGRGKVPLRRRLAWAAALVLPAILAFGLWTMRGEHTPNPAGYNYGDWFMMDLAPDSPRMTAVDFHAPLMGPVPRATVPGLARRVARHAVFYAASLMELTFSPAAVKPGPIGLVSLPAMNRIIPLSLFIIAIIGLVRHERRGPPAAVIFLASYSAVLLLWPMDDPRLLIPLLPFAAFYLVGGLEFILEKIARAAPRKKEQGPAPGRAASICLAAVIVLAAGLHFYRDREYRAWLERLPTVTLSPGFDVRFMSREIMDSFRLLAWVKQNAEPGAVVMYHSPPPCRLVSGHECSSIPYSSDRARVRDFIRGGAADYVVLDEYGKVVPLGPGWFVHNVLRPVVAAYPDDFETVYRIPGTRAEVMRVRREKNGDGVR
ncbi:MAG TPA: hypothetical protein VM658_17310 [bacterium]|nr:hypothetical protein [bacterium]